MSLEESLKKVYDLQGETGAVMPPMGAGSMPGVPRGTQSMSPEDQAMLRRMSEQMSPDMPTLSPQQQAMAGRMGGQMNEPRMEDRSPNNQMFSIESAINNLMTEYDMVVQNQDFQRAQMIADQIDQLQQQKIGIQSQMGDQQMSQAMMGESGRTPSNQDTDQISRILESISI